MVFIRISFLKGGTVESVSWNFGLVGHMVIFYSRRDTWDFSRRGGSTPHIFYDTNCGLFILFFLPPTVALSRSNLDSAIGLYPSHFGSLWHWSICGCVGINSPDKEAINNHDCIWPLGTANVWLVIYSCGAVSGEREGLILSWQPTAFRKFMKYWMSVDI